MITRDPPNFDPLIAALGLDNMEYEPESFPNIDYRPPDYYGLFKISSSGKLWLTGVTDPDGIDNAFERLKQKIRRSQYKV